MRLSSGRIVALQGTSKWLTGQTKRRSEFKQKIFDQLAEAILEAGAIQAVKYYSPKLRIKATRRIFGGKIRKNEENIEILFSIGRLNYAELKFAK